jgi:hypothetical protein
LHTTFDEEKSQNASLGGQNCFDRAFLKTHIEALTPVVDCLDSLIGLGHLFAVPVLLFMGGFGKKSK